MVNQVRSLTAMLSIVSMLVVVTVLGGLGTVALGSWMIAVIGAILTVPVVITGWPLSGVLLILVSTALNRYRFDIAGWGLKLEYVVIAYVFVVWVAQLVTRKGRVQIDRRELILIVWLSVNLLASSLNAPDRNQSFKYLVLLVLLALMYVILVNLFSDEDVLRRAVVVYLIVGIVASLFGIVARWLYVYGLDLGVQLDPVTNDLIPYGTFWEGNIFGSYTMSVALVFLTFLIVSDVPRRYKGILLGGFVVIAFAMLLSLSRGAFVGFAGGSIMLLLLAWRNSLRLWVVVTMIMGFLALISSGIVRMDENQSAILARLVSISNLTEGASWQMRLYYYQQAIESWRGNPLLGWGTGSFGQLYSYVTVDLPAWVGNLEIHVLHDTGLIGLFTFVLFLVMVVGGAIQALGMVATSYHRTLLTAFLVSLVGLLIAYQATEATWLGFTWVHIAFLVAFTRLVREKDLTGVAAQTAVGLDAG